MLQLLSLITRIQQYFYLGTQDIYPMMILINVVRHILIAKASSRPTILTDEQLLWQATSNSANNCDEVTSIDQLPWARELVTGRSPYFSNNRCSIIKGAYFAKYYYKGKTVSEFFNPGSSKGGVCIWGIFDCTGNLMSHEKIMLLNKMGDFRIYKTHEIMLWKN